MSRAVGSLFEFKEKSAYPKEPYAVVSDWFAVDKKSESRQIGETVSLFCMLHPPHGCFGETGTSVGGNSA